MSQHLTTPARRPGQLSLKFQVPEVKAVVYLGVAAELPDNIHKKCCKRIFEVLKAYRPYILSQQISKQFEGNREFPDEFMVEEARPVMYDVVISAECNVNAAQWFLKDSTLKLFTQAFQQILVTKQLLTDMHVGGLTLEVSCDKAEVSKLIKEYQDRSGYTQVPTSLDVQLWTEIEVYHATHLRDHLTWARESEVWLESSLGTFIMTCKQVTNNGEKLNNAVKFSNMVENSTRASVDKTGVKIFMQALRHLAAISCEVDTQLTQKLRHTHRFALEFPALFEARCRILESIKFLRERYSVVLEAVIEPPTYDVYSPWRAKVLAKEVGFMPLISILSHFKEHLLDVDLHLDEWKAQLASNFTKHCTPVITVSRNSKHNQDIKTDGKRAPKLSKLL